MTASGQPTAVTVGSCYARPDGSLDGDVVDLDATVG